MTASLSNALLREHVLRACRCVMPGVAGVVLSASDGRVLAHEEVDAPQELAARALAQWRGDGGEGASRLVPRDDGLYLVVFMPGGQEAASASAIGAAPA